MVKHTHHALLFVATLTLMHDAASAQGWGFLNAPKIDRELPRVLLIGDSIMNGYRGPVITALKGKANVDCWLTPLHLNSKELHHELLGVLEQGPYDVVHFNIGLHGWTPGRIPEGQYEPLLREYVEILRSHSQSVRLVWASTTQITVKGRPSELDLVHNQTIVDRNAIAENVMSEYGIAVNDLYGLLNDHLKLARGDKFHWKGEAYTLMADRIVQQIQAASTAAAPLQVYVAPEGADDGTGTKTNPFQTLERARGEIRKRRKDGVRSLVLLREGAFRRTKTFALGYEDSWTTYRAYPAETVRLVGGKILPASAARPLSNDAIKGRIIEKKARGEVLQIDLKQQGITEFGRLRPRGFRRPYTPAHLELFIDGEPMQLARWPNPGEPRVPIDQVLDGGSIPRNGDFSGRGGMFRFATSRPDHWQSANNIWISGFFNYGYADDTVEVKAVDFDKQTIQTVQPHMYGFRSGKAWNAWYALNLLEEIDQPGEFFCDTDGGMLYFYPPKGYDPERARIEVSVLEEPMLAIEGAESVHVKGMTLECTRGMGVYIERGEACRVIGCTLRNMGIVGACIGQGTEDLEHYAHMGTAPPASRRLGSWHEHIYENTVFDRKAGKKHGIVSCDIYNMGAGGLHVGGGNRRTLEAAGNYVRNCDIYNFNRLGRSYKAGVNIDGVGNRIEHCNIHSAPAVAVYLHGNDHMLQLNEFHHVMTDGDDMGAFYMGRDPAEYGNVIRHNFLHHIGRTPQTHRTWGIYYDDMACGTKAYGNIFCQVGKAATFLVGGGKYNEITNNIFIDSELCVQMDNRGEGWARGNLTRNGLFEQRTLNHPDITKPPYSKRYPKLAKYWQDDPGKPRNLITRNLLVRCGKLTSGRPEWGPVVNNWMVDEDPGFADMAAGDFTLSEDSPAYSKITGFQPIPFAKMGLTKDAWRHELPARAGFAQNVDGSAVKAVQ